MTSKQITHSIKTGRLHLTGWERISFYQRVICLALAGTATFAYPRACNGGGDPMVYTVGMVKSNGRWVIDDVNYGEDTTLKERLRRKEY